MLKIRRYAAIVIVLVTLFIPAAIANDGKVALAIEQGASGVEAKVLGFINAQREKQGLSPLERDEGLENVARIKAQDMLKQDYLSHTSPTYGSPFEMLEAFGIKYGAAGENIASGRNSARAIVNDWLNCPGERCNIFNPMFTQAGIGAVRMPDGRYCCVFLFIKP